MTEPVVDSQPPSDTSPDSPRSYTPVAGKRHSARERVHQRGLRRSAWKPIGVNRTTFITASVLLAVMIAVGVAILFLVQLLTPAELQKSAGKQTSAGLAEVRQDSISANPPNIRPWDSQRRFTILVMGLDRRPDWVDIGRSDSMIILSIDPRNKSVGMLSIPRDLFVAFPNQSGLHRIDTAIADGELQKPGGGPELAAKTVQYNFGIPIDSYMVVQFDGVITLVDAVGGIDVNVATAIDDPEYPDMHYGYDPLHIPAGKVHMDGQLALKYARTRHQTNDYDRANRQQQVLLAMRQKVLSPGVLAQLLPQVPGLWDHLSQWFNTDLSLDQMLSIGWYAKDIPATNIHRAVIEGDYLQATQYEGEAVVMPNRSNIAQLLTQVFGADYTH